MFYISSHTFPIRTSYAQMITNFNRNEKENKKKNEKGCEMLSHLPFDA